MAHAALLTGRRKIQQPAVLSTIALILFVVVSCAPRQMPVLSPESGKFRPTMLAAAVRTTPGGFAWSKDGRTLAYIRGDEVTLYDRATKERRTVALSAPHFVRWSEEHRLFVLYRENGRDKLCSVDRESLVLKRLPVAEGALAVYPTSDGRELLILTSHINRYAFGTGISLDLIAYGRADDAPKPLYSVSKTYPVKEPDLRYYLSWTHAGLHPIDESLLVFEQTKPPLKAPYSRAITIDSLSGEVAELFGQERQILYTSARWSPDGGRLALSDWNGRIEITTIRGARIVLDRSRPGFYPSWSPRGDRIFAGGYLMDRDGKNAEALMRNDPWSIAEWSPDGTLLAAASHNELWLFNNVSAPSISPGESTDTTVLKKIALLRELFRDKLITPEEYRERRNSLMKGSESAE